MHDKAIQQDIKRKFYKNDRWLLVIWIAILYSVVNAYNWQESSGIQLIERVFIITFLFLTIIFAGSFKGYWLKILLICQALVALWSMRAFNSPVLSFISPVPAMLFEEILLGKRLSQPPLVSICYTLFALVIVFYDKEMNWINILLILQALIGLGIAVRVVYYNLSSLVRQTEELLKTNIKLNRANKQIADLTAEKVQQEFARDLHDTLTQDLVGINMRVSAVGQLLDKENYEKAKAVVNQTEEMTETSIMQARRMIKEYRNINTLNERTSLKQNTLDTIAIIKKDYSLQTVLKINHDCNILVIEQLDIQRVIGEALMNVVKHGKTNQALVNITVVTNKVTVEIINHGKTWNKNIKEADHFGITNMKERAGKYNGNVTFTPLTPGLKVTATFEIKEEI